MVLVDTSVWVDHFRRGLPGLVVLLEAGEVLCHPFVIGELACGHLHQRDEILGLLQNLPSAPRLHDPELLAFIRDHRLMGRGISLIDVHLLASARLSRASLWTLDRKLAAIAGALNLVHDR